MPETPTPDDFGVFNPIFETAQNYLGLLSLSDRDAKRRVRKVLSCVGASSAFAAVEPLLDGLNWRPHLVVAVVLAKHGYESNAFGKVWRAIDQGSWVTPQLAALAAWHDPHFVPQALERLKSLSPEAAVVPPDLTPAERRAAEEHAGLLHLSPKAAAAMARLLSLLPEKTPQLAKELESDEIKKLLRDDYDGAGVIAERWLARLKPLVVDL